MRERHPETTTDVLERVLREAHGARPWLADQSPPQRRALLNSVADALDLAVDRLVTIAAAETHLTEARLRGEVARASFQFRCYGEAIESETRTEHDLADTSAIPAARPDLHLTTRPIGVVLNFAASNFPFAFSVVGTDTASALATGCPVVVKAHSGHPLLSQATFDVMDAALRAAGAPAGTVGIVFGRAAGIAALQDPRVSAATFTGSVPGGRALFDIASARPVPIPFYGELGSLNPVVVAPAAAAARGEEILAGFAASVTGSSGQLCTKPGLLFWPDAVPFADRIDRAMEASAVHPLLTEALHEGFTENVARVSAAGAQTVTGKPGTRELTAIVLRTTTEELTADPEGLLVECFGPAALVVTYADEADLLLALRSLHGNLTAGVFADDDDAALARAVLPGLEQIAGRLLWDQWPTGVSVTRAQFHGGPYPATTNPLHTSVGPHALARFLRPIAYQNFPDVFLPRALQATSP